MNPLDDTRYCPMCETAAKTIEDQKRTIEALNSCIGGEGSLTTENITRVEELEQRVKVLTNAITSVLPTLRAYEHCATSVTDSLQQALSQTPQQTAAQIERGHVEWMMKLPSAGYFQCVNGRYEQTVNPETDKEYIAEMRIDTSGLHKLFAIPPLPKESNHPKPTLTNG